jgi:hypothetical protein
MLTEKKSNNAAALPARLPYQPLEWSAITMYVDPTNHTMATLYGNETARRSLNLRSTDAATALSYTQGAVPALVAWIERDDPHWFGARIPDTPQSIEFVEVGLESGKNNYRRFTGAQLAPAIVESTTQTVIVLL